MDKLILGIIVLLSFKVISSDKVLNEETIFRLKPSINPLDIQTDSDSILNKLIELPTGPKKCSNNNVNLSNMPVIIPDSSLTESMPIYIPPPVYEQMVIPIPGLTDH